MIDKSVKEILEVLKDEPIAVAVSGGSDSMALLYFILDYGFSNVSVINFEHGIRGENSVRDSKFVKDYCTKRGVAVKVVSLNTIQEAKQNKTTIEETARKLRYDYFEKVLSAGIVKYVFLAHHKKDQAETVLMRILRGTGIDGLEGMKVLSNGYVRPFLHVDKEEIMGYVAKHNIPYVTDETNDDENYSRNFIRSSVLPLIKTKYPKVEDSLCRLADIASGVNACLDARINVSKISDSEVKVAFNKDKEIFSRSVKEAFRLLGIEKDVEYRHYEMIYLLQTLDTGASVDTPYFTNAVKDYDGIVICKKRDNEEYCEPFELEINLAKTYDKATFTPYKDKIKRGEGLYFDYDKLPCGCVIRRRKEGDYIEKFGGGTKSFGDYLTDKKVPKRYRDSLLVVAKDSEIFIAVGVDISNKVKVVDESLNIYKVTTEKEDERI